mmetsp:Transcript_8808/g.20942  ORF Transcript_8808/g.20942 Transcript_8808/m.20942 type:complete len:692 (-) Transcript_8808:94-2169(-)
MAGRYIAILAALLLCVSLAHRPMVNGVSCGVDFGSPEAPLQVPDLTEYWGAHRIATCDAPVFWLNFSVSDSTRRYLDISAGSLHPASSFGSERLLDLRVDAVVLEPNLPALDKNQLEIDLPEGMDKGVLLLSADDASSCRHTQTEMVTEVSQGLCAFYDSFGPWGVWSSVLLDRHVPITSAGLVAFWLRGQRTGKFWVMLGAAGPERPEDLFGNNRIPKASCNDCGNVDPSRPSDAFSGSADFWELWTPPGKGLPLVTECAGAPARDSYCSLQGTTPTSTVSATTQTTTRTSTSVPATTDELTSDSPTTDSSSPSTTTTEEMTSTVASSVHVDTSTTTQTESTSSTTASTSSRVWMEHMAMSCGPKVCLFRDSMEAVAREMHQKMALQLTCDPDVDFVRGMIPHHEGAVAMCAALDDAQDWMEVGLVHFCYHVALEQTWEVRGMQEWLNSRNLSAGEGCKEELACGRLDCASSQAFVAANRRMMQVMAINYTCRPEVDFVQAMLPHHKGAVEMCAVLLESSSQDEYLRDLCANITRLQTAEMSWMKDWLSFKGFTAAAQCGETVALASPCADMMPITDICHDLGGDRLCDCTELQNSCSDVATAGGRRFAVSTVCRQTCGLCESKSSADIIVELLELGRAGAAKTTSSSATTDSATSTTTGDPVRASVASGNYRKTVVDGLGLLPLLLLMS